MTLVDPEFPRQKARTRNFTLGVARHFRVAPDGSRVLFLRSPAGDDPRQALWAFEDGRERLVVDPAALGDVDENPSEEERARRERARESAAGITGFATDRAARIAAFSLGGALWIADVATGDARMLDVDGPVYDPRPDPTGRRVAFVREGALHVADAGSGEETTLAEEPEIGWGVAEFVGAEEIDRLRGYWWSPDGETLLAARVDERDVRTWWIADPTHPDATPRSVRYPAAGTPNARVTLHAIAADGTRGPQIAWDHDALPYLVDVQWDEQGPAVTVQSRDQRRLVVLAADPATGATRALHEQGDADWVDLIAGVPRRLPDGSLVTAATAGDTTALVVGGERVTPDGLEVLSVLRVAPDEILLRATEDPSEAHVFAWTPDDGITRLTSEPGLHTAAAGGSVTVLGSASLDHDGVRWTIGEHAVASHAERPRTTPRVRLHRLGDAGLRTGILLPRDHEPGRKLPVLLDPYGGPGRARVAAARDMWREAQWLADQGFAVVAVDGRGTPGRGRAWTKGIAGDLAAPTLDDQVTALHAAAEVEPALDLGRVAIRGWSFGGFLAALAVLRRPDVFHAAVAGAPVTDWRLYDTHYTERYLGTDPDGADAEAYDRSSLLRDAPKLDRPLMIIHGFADDNVVVAHTLSFSKALLEAGRPHTVLPLTGATHMTPPPVAENLLLLQVDFLRRALTRADPRHE